MKNYILDGAKMTSLTEAYAELKAGLNLPDYFGHNLDAFEECLRDKLVQEGAFEIVVDHAKAVATLPEWPALAQVFQDTGVKIELRV